MTAPVDPRETLTAILRELDAEAGLADFVDALEGSYAFRVRVGDDVGKVMTARYALVDRAAMDREARRALARILQSELRLVRSGRAVGESSETLAATWSPGAAVSGPPPGLRVMAGRVVSVDPALGIVVIGHLALQAPESMSLAGVQPGSHVTAEYELRDGSARIVSLRILPIPG